MPIPIDTGSGDLTREGGGASIGPFVANAEATAATERECYCRCCGRPSRFCRICGRFNCPYDEDKHPSCCKTASWTYRRCPCYYLELARPIIEKRVARRWSDQIDAAIGTEDVTQDAFRRLIRALRKRQNREPVVELSAEEVRKLARGIARQSIADAYRRAGRRERRAKMEPIPASGYGAVDRRAMDPAELIADEDEVLYLWKQVESFLAGVSGPQREIVTMRLYGSSYKDIASELHMTTDAVRQQFCRFRKDFEEWRRS